VDEDKLKAYATITFDNSFIVRDLKVISGNKGFFIAMPSKKRKDGTFRDVAHPLNSETRKMIEDAVLDVYKREAASGTPPTPYPEGEEDEAAVEPAAAPEPAPEADPEADPEPEPESEPEENPEADPEAGPEADGTVPASVADEEEPEKGAEENPAIEPSDDPDKAFGYEE
jgi:stage V sporulation protein G